MTETANSRDERYMRIALHEAGQAAQRGEVPVGAIIVHDDTIVGRGSNSCEALQDATAHAEMIAITAASDTLKTWRLEGCTMYVTLEPCPMCMGASLNSRIERIVYAAAEPKAGACGSVCDLTQLQRFNHTIDVVGGVLAAESATMLKAFFKKLRAKKKSTEGS